MPNAKIERCSECHETLLFAHVQVLTRELNDHTSEISIVLTGDADGRAASEAAILKAIYWWAETNSQSLDS